MNQEKEHIFSSTGSPGVTRRQDSRIYINPETFSTDPVQVRTLDRLARVVERNAEQVSRGVFRGAVSGDVLQTIQEQEFHRGGLEVVLPLEEFLGDEDSSYLIYWSTNHPERSQIVSTELMMQETTQYPENRRSPRERISQTLRRGYRFTNTIPEDQVEQVYQLWHETFGWEYQEVIGLMHRLTDAATRNPADRDVWFSAIRDNGTIISASMAERLSMPVANGELDLVESTEWRTRDEYAGQGLMTATLAMLNAQILSDFRRSEKPTPLIYAECNFQSRSDRAGYGAGFVIPSRDHAPQILIQNVRVGDGQHVPEGKLRDFTFMYLPKDTVNQSYDPVQTDAMVSQITYHS